MRMSADENVCIRLNTVHEQARLCEQMSIYPKSPLVHTTSRFDQHKYKPYNPATNKKIESRWTSRLDANLKPTLCPHCGPHARGDTDRHMNGSTHLLALAPSLTLILTCFDPGCPQLPVWVRGVPLAVRVRQLPSSVCERGAGTSLDIAAYFWTKIPN